MWKKSPLIKKTTAENIKILPNQAELSARLNNTLSKRSEGKPCHFKMLHAKRYAHNGNTKQ